MRILFFEKGGKKNAEMRKEILVLKPKKDTKKRQRKVETCT